MLCCTLIACFFAQPLLLFEKVAARFGVFGLKLLSLAAPSPRTWVFSPAAIAVAMGVELFLAALAIASFRLGLHGPLPLGLLHLCRVRL